MNQVEKVKELHQKLKNSFSSFEVQATAALLEELAEIAKTECYYSCLGAFYFYQNNYDKVNQVSREGIDKFPYASTLHYNLATVLYLQGEAINAVDALAHAKTYAQNTNEIEIINNKFEEFMNGFKNNGVSEQHLKMLQNQYDYIIEQVDARYYPLDRSLKSLLRRVLNEDSPYENMTNYYKHMTKLELDEQTRFQLKTERFIGKSGYEFNYSFNRSTVLPVSLLQSGTYLEIKVNNEILNLHNSYISANQFHYITFEPGDVSIRSSKKIFVGNQILLKDEPKKKKLIMNLFVDGVCAEYLSDNNIPFLPYSKKMFEKVYDNSNCYTTSDWTYPSIASLFTGLSMLNHNQYHPNYYHDFSEKNSSLIEKLRDCGYYTTGISGCWRSTPLQGYGNSFDRVVYKNSIGEFGVSEVVEEAIEHLEAFPDKNNFMWLVIPDLHDIPDCLYRNIKGQVNLSSKERFSNPVGATSVLTEFNVASQTRYKLELERIDFYLARLLNYVKSKYSEDEVLIVIHSDHGQGYLSSNTKGHLDEERTKIPFLMFGSGLNKKSDELMSLLDIYPTVFDIIEEKHHIASIDGVVLADFGGSGRTYALTENYHPGQPYRAMIKDDKVQIHFETVDHVGNSGLVDIEKYNISAAPLNDKVSEEEVIKLKQHYFNLLQNRILHLQTD